MSEENFTSKSKQSEEAGGAAPHPDQIQALAALYNQGDLAAVVEQASGLLNQFPNSIELYNLLGASFGNLGQFNKAEQCLARALQINPTSCELMTNLGVAQRALGRIDDAVSNWRAALDINPNYAAAHNNLGLALSDLGRPVEALTHSTTALNINPNLAEAHYNVGAAHAALTQPHEALSAYLKALEVRPDFPEAHNSIGTIYIALQRPDDAISAFTKATEIRPGYAEAHYNLGTVLTSIGRPEDAITAYAKALEAKPEFPEAHNNIGNAYHSLKRPHEAISAFRKAVELGPGYAEAHCNLGTVLSSLGKSEEAISHYTKALEINPDSATAQGRLAHALKESWQYDGAIAAYSKALELEPEQREYWQGLMLTLGAVTIDDYNEAHASLWVKILSKKTLFHRDVTLAPVLRLLKRHVLLRGLVENAPLLTSKTKLQETVRELGTVPLLLKLLESCPLPKLDIETAVKTVRRAILLNLDQISNDQNTLKFQASLACQCWINEFVYGETDEERRALDHLEREASKQLSRGESVEDKAIACLASYRPLHRYEWVDALNDRPALAQVFRLQVRDVREDAALRKSMPTLKKIQDPISLSVREQYEQNPYPRWVYTNLHGGSDQAASIISIAKRISLGIDESIAPSSSGLDILIAGCGTGQQAVNTASRFSGSSVLAVDLSLNSLSYAKRKTAEFGITNIEYLQADILDLSSLDRQFDIVESTGVLHHMDDPMAGWEVLEECLKPGGLMKIALYSKLARQSVTGARERIASLGLTNSKDDILKFRSEVLSSKDKDLLALQVWADMYSTSEFRDLVFHVQEHQFTLPQIQECLSQLNLTFVGFELSGADKKIQFKAAHPDPADMYNLDVWHAYELAHPDLFVSMYQLWLQKPSDEANR